MSKIEDDTQRAGRQRADASASIADGANLTNGVVDDLDDAPVVVPANDDWSVDDDGPASSNGSLSNRSGSNGSGSSSNGSGNTETVDLGWSEPPLPGLEKPGGSNGSTNGRSSRRVKRFAADRTDLSADVDPNANGTSTRNGTDAQADTTNSGEGSRSSNLHDVGDPLIGESVESSVDDGSTTAVVGMIDVDEDIATSTASTGPIPLVIHEQTAVEPAAHEGDPAVSRRDDFDRYDVDHAFDDPWSDGWVEAGPATTQTAVVNYGTPAAGMQMSAVQPEVTRRRRVRRVNRILRHVDPWSVFKVGLLFNVIGYLVVMTAGVLLWDVASRTGTLPNIERWATQFGWETFALDGGAIFRNAAVAGLFAAVGLTGAMVMFATVFNLVSDAIGGIRVSVLEEEVIAVADDGSVVTPSMTSSHHVPHADNWAVEDF